MLDTATGQAWNFEEPSENTLLNVNIRPEFFAPKTDVLGFPVEPNTTAP